ncbi:MAG: hypothetical protein COA96_00815 [SAR86 cluster bacterium]|uniref:C-type lectin domain-containing protein n=1 Tax=SAR86 cluster bacterium TaxID=2030880 RepID=A0A2A5BB89_9GAMM|nr:MAG: hypothetical protein COA96_00815 [SAR86 cluster bacterium]
MKSISFVLWFCTVSMVLTISTRANAIPIGACQGTAVPGVDVPIGSNYGIIDGFVSEEVDGYCYIFNSTLLTWSEHEAVAQSIDSDFHLSSISSVEENIYLHSRILGTTWIGLNNADNFGTYVFADGSSVGYLNWVMGHPNNRNNRYTAMLVSNGEWIDQEGIHTNAGLYRAIVDSSAVPEPSSFALLALGLAGLRFKRRKDRVLSLAE